MYCLFLVHATAVSHIFWDYQSKGHPSTSSSTTSTPYTSLCLIYVLTMRLLGGNQRLPGVWIVDLLILRYHLALDEGILYLSKLEI